MGNRKCVYCNNTRDSKMSKEHIISRSVLKSVFGESIRNVSSGAPINKTVIDLEHVIKDVCRTCNSDLSTYDSRGRMFAENTKAIYNATDFMLPIDVELINWFIKTHLNFLRSIPDIQTSEKYEVSSEIYKKLLRQDVIGSDYLQLYVEGFEGLPYFWNEESEKKIPYFSYRSVRSQVNNIVISNFRFKFLDTFILLPYKSNYQNFDIRCKNVVDEISFDFGFNLQRINYEGCAQSEIKVENVISSETLLRTVIQKVSL